MYLAVVMDFPSRGMGDAQRLELVMAAFDYARAIQKRVWSSIRQPVC